MRNRSFFPALLSCFVLGSCNPQQAASTAKPAPDYTAAQRGVWSGVPEGVKFGVTAGSAAHLLDRANALNKLVCGGQKGRAFVDKHMAEVKSKLGFDPLDAGAWKQKNVDLEGPIGFFLFENGDALMAAKPIDGAKAKVDWVAALGEKTVCTQSGALLYCGDTRTLPATDAAKSAWPSLSKDLKPEQAAAELQLFVPLAKAAEAASGAASIMGKATTEFIKASQSAFVGLTFADDEIHLQASYVNPKSAELAPYLPINKNEKTLLGAATGSRGAARITFSPHALWELAKRTAGAAALDQASGAMLVATGLDLQKDIAENLTGEILAITYSKGGLVELFGTSDDERTKKLVERIDGLSWGGLQTIKETVEKAGWKVDHRVDTMKDRKAYVFEVHLPKDAQDPTAKTNAADDTFELHLSSGPGAFFIAFDKESRDRAFDSLGKPASAFTSQMRPEAQEPFTSGAPLAFWGETFNLMQTFDYTQKINDAQKDLLKKTYGAIDPDLPDLIWELSALGALMYDGIGSLKIDQDRMTLDYRITLL